MAFFLRPNVLGKPGFSSLIWAFRQNGGNSKITHIGMKACCFSSVVEAEAPELECDEIHDDVRSTERDIALRFAVSQLDGESMLSKFFGMRRASVIPTGSLKLDVALGIGGLPKGRIVEIYGREASGKTTLALHIIKEAQKLGGYCAYLDVENGLDPSLVESMGISTQNLLISHPDSAENLLSMVDTLTKSGSLDVIVVDSVAALVPKCELDQLIGGTNQDMQSQIMTQALRKIQYSLSQSRTLIVFINQVRFNPKSGNGFGRIDEVTCGGNALRFYAAVRLRLVRIGLLKAEEKITGLRICAEVVKNKLAPAMKKAELGIEFGRGFCRESEVLELACELGVVVTSGDNYLISGESFSNKHAAEQYLAVNDDGVLDKLIMDIRSHLFERER
ncbi:DNA repair protein RecA mitochondrial-like [Quillaja saponaria]|uniref:DNA repair protein RecA mitochondrial-like n=1 Tax=Quillaja saponaria TaxID=32244 RepID=A0AAD7Q8A1_QUISA|nr:DNA repair protein RecA mitochondrial-like [Quillaja saponaria]KAJ7976722.1 DNA repair protein RecA mitochondrial-like [Quillaja saponaria]